MNENDYIPNPESVEAFLKYVESGGPEEDIKTLIRAVEMLEEAQQHHKDNYLLTAGNDE